MSEDKFEKLKKIAKEEFGVDIIKGDKPNTFKTVFGLEVKDIEALNIPYTHLASGDVVEIAKDAEPHNDMLEAV